MKSFVKVYKNFRKSCYATNCRSKFVFNFSVFVKLKKKRLQTSSSIVKKRNTNCQS